ncbi:hypothetical protein J4558_23110 [Leptolyngbya sp. 15MV]|nr:hypothetical protein J4558_23110 [Leptolyngbya sp. 15MV]
MATLRLTAADATVRFLAAQQAEIGGRILPLFGGVWAIFGHGNVAGLGPALHAHRKALPTFRAHNEQAMAHAAIAYAKTHARRRMMACTSSIGPGATNMVTAAAVAHVNRLPVLFLPGDVFASRRPDPVLQQVECFSDATVSANDCFRPVSSRFDRIMRAEQLLAALPAALRVLTDPAACGPVTLAFPQDVQTEALDWPAAFFRKRVWRPRAPEPRREFPGTFLDVHLMVMQPERFVEAFAEAGADHVTFHAEVRQGGAAVRLAEHARSLGMTAGIALNPGTPAWVIRPIVGAFELVLVMSVEPGFSGQKFRGEVVEKVREIRSWVGAEKRVEMDGGIGIAESRVVRDAGCDVIVSASAIFGRGGPERAGVIRGLRGESSRTL